MGSHNNLRGKPQIKRTIYEVNVETTSRNFNRLQVSYCTAKRFGAPAPVKAPIALGPDSLGSLFLASGCSADHELDGYQGVRVFRRTGLGATAVGLDSRRLGGRWIRGPV